MAKACNICTGVDRTVKEATDGVTIAQRKKNLGLLAASYVGHKNCVNFYVREGGDVNCTDKDLNPKCRKKLCKKVGRKILRNYNDLRWSLCRQGDNWTPLMYAAENNLLETVEVLINAGADVNLVKNNVNALLVAAGMVHYKCIELLIGAGASVNFADPTITPALICAALTHTENIVSIRKSIEILIKAEADVNVRFNRTRSSITTPLIEVAKCGSPRTLSMLLEAGADVNFGHGGNFPLHLAALNCIESVELLIEAGVDVNQQDGDGNTALGKTLVFYTQKTFNALMKLGANVNIVNNQGMTALMITASCYPDQRDGYSVAELKSQKKRCVQRTCHLLKSGAQIGRLSHIGNNSLQGSLRQNQKRINDMQMLLYAAGETLDGPTFATEDYSNGNIIHLNIPEYFTELKEKLDLKHLCREAIRKHLIHLDPHENLFGRIPQLGLPSLVTEYLLYNCSLDYKGAVGNEETDSD